MSGLPNSPHQIGAIDDLLDREAAARILGVSPRTLDRWHLLRIGPPRLTIGGRTVRYRLSSLDSWIASQEAVGPEIT